MRSTQFINRKTIRVGLASFAASAIVAALSQAAAAQDWPQLKEGDFVIRNFLFRTGETLPELRLHYATLGSPQRDAAGRVSNAVLILHGTGGSGRQFLRQEFAAELFGPRQLLDASRYFIILPDNIGHGRSSKPSDGLRTRFPRYDYDEMVALQHRLVTEGLGVSHLRLILGTSMGCMHSWVWGETFPDFMDALMPLACLPAEIAGRNRIMRRMILDSIRTDPSWKAGFYGEQPRGLRAALYILLIMSSSPLQMQKTSPTRDAADRYLDDWLNQRLRSTDANDMLYQFDASRNYNPAPNLEKIIAHVMFINTADDLINPPELGIAEHEIKRVKNGRLILLPTSEQTRGHGSHTLASLWKHLLAELIEASKR